MTPMEGIETPAVSTGQASATSVDEPGEEGVRYMPETEAALYAIGYRKRWQVDEDGKRVLHVYPLTPDDALHPLEGDRFVTSDFHFKAIVEMENFLELCRDRGDPSWQIFGDMDVDLGLPGIKPVRPDLIIFEGVERPEHLRQHVRFFRVARESERLRVPLVMEVTSEHTRDNDCSTEKKLGYYDQSRMIAQYIIIDAAQAHEGEPIQLLDYVREREHLVLRAPDARGRVRVDCLDAWLDLVERDGRTHLRLWDATTDEVLPGLRDLHDRMIAAQTQAQQERDRAQQERDRAEQERKRADALEAELARLRQMLERTGHEGEPTG